jgi:hypothetical protein
MDRELTAWRLAAAESETAGQFLSDPSNGAGVLLLTNYIPLFTVISRHSPLTIHFFPTPKYTAF